MSATPETDEAEFDGIDGQGGMIVISDFARKLERERDEARECFRVAMELAARYKREREQWRECAERLAAQLHWWWDNRRLHGPSQNALVDFRKLKGEAE